ncbi:winged helix-turn-helix domain-containing protein [Klebsiella sp. R390]|uniref:winged helix-turn-helix domain-containing protein n=1 Tax=Klebsiella sp. R390 TaxID=2755400 RepID=UPI003DA92F06
MTFNEYIINGEVVFDVNDNGLRPLGEHGERVSLNAPTARCLQLLLESHGKIVSREEFLDTVWKTRGVVVSQNTFYQNISLLRRSLSKAGLSKDIISTVRQQGFVLTSDSHIISSFKTEDVPAEQEVDIQVADDVVAPPDNNHHIKERLIEGEVKVQHHDKAQYISRLPRWILPLLVAAIAANALSIFWLVVINE